MNRDTIKAAQEAAWAFLRAADAALALREGEAPNQHKWHGMGTAASGECRHLSMLLTRALARMRRPG